MTARDVACSDFLPAYRQANRDLLDAEPEFAAWLETEYRPIAGGWQY